jgi:hypothetical protein
VLRLRRPFPLSLRGALPPPSFRNALSLLLGTPLSLEFGGSLSFLQQFGHALAFSFCSVSPLLLCGAFSFLPGGPFPLRGVAIPNRRAVPP